MKKDNLLYNATAYIINEHKDNIKAIPDLSKEISSQQTLRTSLGRGWVFIRDIIYFAAFIIFRYLMSGPGTIEGMGFTLFLMIGLIPWNFMNECINGAVGAIKDHKSVISSLKFPVGILPTIEVSAIFLKRLFTLLFLLFVIIFFGDIQKVTLWMFIYYFVSMYIFMCVWNLIFSALVAISNDFEQLYRAISSIIFFTLPVMWSFDIVKDFPRIIMIFKINPFVYLIEGFRDACYSGTMPNLAYTAYFWGLTLVLFCIGSILQYKLKSHYVDVI